jgi:intracellular sulfur oxidation DsrE/DsrF family protein
MKKSLLIILFLASATILLAQDKLVSIVFDVTSADPATHQSAVRHVKAMAASYPSSNFEVVVYGGSIEMVLKEKSSVSEDILGLAGNDRVSFKVCQGTMNRHEIKKEDLLPNVEIVPDGILEIVTKQGEGWGYIKESHN